MKKIKKIRRSLRNSQENGSGARKFREQTIDLCRLSRGELGDPLSHALFGPCRAANLRRLDEARRKHGRLDIRITLFANCHGECLIQKNALICGAAAGLRGALVHAAFCDISTVSAASVSPAPVRAGMARIATRPG